MNTETSTLGGIPTPPRWLDAMDQAWELGEASDRDREIVEYVTRLRTEAWRIVQQLQAVGITTGWKDRLDTDRVYSWGEMLPLIRALQDEPSEADGEKRVTLQTGRAIGKSTALRGVPKACEGSVLDQVLTGLIAFAKNCLESASVLDVDADTISRSELPDMDYLARSEVEERFKIRAAVRRELADELMVLAGNLSRAHASPGPDKK